jgi:mannosyltransferase
MKALTPAASLRHSPWLTVLLVAILLLALGLRFYRLGAQSLWNDEGTSVAVAGRDLGTIAQDAANDIHPPLYYWLLSGWLRTFGSSEAAVRSLSALLGVALVALIYAVGRWTAGRWAGALAALLAAMNPFQVY